MDLLTVLLIVLAAITALSISYYQYFYKNPRKGSLNIILAALRFVSFFCGLLLIVNPKFIHSDYFLEKTNLIVLVDDSSSMTEGSTKSEILETVDQIKNNPNLNSRFTIQQYSFGGSINQTDSIHLDQYNTDISKALSTIDEIYLNGNTAVAMLTDGIQTLGRDYEFIQLSDQISVNPIVVGDTTQHEDISVGFVNANKYAFLKNKFPVEANIVYQGSKSVSRTATFYLDGERVYQERLSLNPAKNSQVLKTVLQAKSVGVKTLKIEIGQLDNEKNTANNIKETAIEVIDEKTDVILISDILHPDIGALKKSIESNEQRSVSIEKPSATNSKLSEADILILYQPTRNFVPVYDFIKKSGINHFTITGSKTDWNFLNSVQQSFTKENNNQSEEILPVLNNAFGIFGMGEFNVNGFPPLIGGLGEINLSRNGESIMFQQIRGINLDRPLFTVLEEGKKREAVLFGENIWRWRAQSYRNDQNFSKFDAFIGNLMVYLGTDNQRNRLTLDYELVFDNANAAKIRASYFDESYQFDSNADISISVTGKNNDFFRESPMLLKVPFYEADLSDLKAGEYQFTVTVQGDGLKRSGSFRILDFNPEKQLTSANYKKLGRLAQKSNGQLYYLNNVDSLIEDLSTSQRYLPIQKSKQNVVSLIDFRILLGLIVLSLALEWFIRKYNGLI